jgi:hypothetical protein
MAMIRKVLSVYCFVFGCAFAVSSIVWPVMMLTRGETVMPGSRAMMAIFVCWGIAMMETANYYSWRDWKPLVTVTPVRILAARGILVALSATLGIAVVMSVTARLQGHLPKDWVLMWMFSNLFTLNGSYIALHWALRPTNLFGAHHEFFMDPARSLLKRIVTALGSARRSSKP